MKHKVIDNFLSEDEFLSIKNGVLHNFEFPWFFRRRGG